MNEHSLKAGRLSVEDTHSLIAVFLLHRSSSKPCAAGIQAWTNTKGRWSDLRMFNSSRHPGKVLWDIRLEMQSYDFFVSLSQCRLDLSHRPRHISKTFKVLLLLVCVCYIYFCCPGFCHLSHKISFHSTFCITNGTLTFGVPCSIHLLQQPLSNG